MPFSIKNKAVEEKARELSRLTGKSLTEAIGLALESHLKTLGSNTKNLGLVDSLMSISTECSQLPDIDTRSSDEILGYTKDGGF